uniref:cilia- and flagella-associated protein 157 isoform X2 n=1 Tax=Monopterus albus TaxID=43700 RepID=UPI0009B376A7|nr:uncharacterized protein C9orf117 homolog isoform X2 [Monopterus albus]
MPKKKAKKGGDKQDEDRKTSKNERPTNKIGPDKKEKDVYLIQIRYKLKNDELERQKKVLNTQYHTLEEEEKDTVEYLKRSLLEKEDEADKLTECLESQRQAADKDRDALQLQHSQLKELQGRLKELTEEKAALVEEFQQQKEQLMSNMAREEQQHKVAIHKLEMKALQENRRLEEEIDSRMAAQVKHLVDQQVSETIRLVLQSNTKAKAAISQLSEQVQALKKENSALMEENSVLMEENSPLQQDKIKLSMEVDILEQTVREISRQSCIHKKVAEQLTEKCQQLQAEEKDCKQELEQLQAKHKATLAEMEALRCDQASLSEQSSASRAEVSRLEAKLEEERSRSSRMKSIMQEAATTLRQAMMELITKQESEVDSVVQWKELMQKLLVVLDRQCTSFTAEKEQLNELQTSDLAAIQAATLDPASSFHFHLARYKLGDLGLVPPPALKHKHALPRMRPGASSTTMPLHRKPGQKTASSSIIVPDSAVGFLTSKHLVTKRK